MTTKIKSMEDFKKLTGFDLAELDMDNEIPSVYLIYDFFVSGYNFLGNFNLYLGLDELRSLLTDTSFLIFFWLHFIAINLFCGSWMVSDSQKFMISKILIFFPLIITYFIGPVGILIYWLIRIFFAKRISLYD